MPQVRDESDAEPIHAPLPALVPAVLASSSDAYCSVVIDGSEMSWRCLAASDSKRVRASSAPPSPSRHDPWRFLRCVWICVIALAEAGGGGPPDGVAMVVVLVGARPGRIIKRG